MTSHTDFRIVPLDRDVVAAARKSMRDEHGNALVVLRDGEPHQCRSCLRLSLPTEGVILLAYRPFASRHPYAEVGPIFVHERECEPYEDIGTYPPEFPRRAVVLRGYDDRDRIVSAEAVGDRRVEDVIAESFGSPATAYLHARNLGYGCFMFRIDRA
jgi:hypothetical protein